MLKSTPLKLGILGCGSFIQRRILPYLHEMEEIKVTCIQKRDKKEAEEVAKRFNISSSVTTREEILHHPDVEAVMIATQNHLHEEDAIACAKVKKPTLCEKPLAPTARGVKRMLDAFQKEHIPFLVGHSLRFKPSIRKAKDLLAQGALGKLLQLRVYFSVSVPENSWKLKKENGGGVLQDIGIHLIDIIQFISGDSIGSIYAKMVNREVDETVSALCSLSNGAFASFECSFSGPQLNGFEVVATKGKLISVGSLRQTFDPGETLCLIQEDQTQLFFPLQASNVYVNELNHFARVVKKGEIPLIPAEIGLVNQKIVEAAYKSASEKREVFVS